ncbi:hypothetical protein DFH06DRAFT_1477396 [Mycena polygramma]|nr:hypothetical protein DFH06DRAFT_1477396 [Mycena polygramma]
MRSLYTASKNLGRICAQQSPSPSRKAIVRDWHRIARVGREEERLEEFSSQRPIPTGGWSTFARLALYLPPRLVGLHTPAHPFFYLVHRTSLPPTTRDALNSAPPATPDDALAGAEHDDAPRRPGGRPRRDASAAAVPDSSDASDALQSEKHADAPRRPRGRPRRDTLPCAAPDSPGDALTGAAPDDAPRRPRGRPRRYDAPPGSPSKPGAETVLPAVPSPQSKFADPVGLGRGDPHRKV